MNRTYELMFIVRPDMTEEDQDKLISTLETAVTSSGGQVKNMEKMGKRRLAYMVRRFHDGLFLLLTFEGSGGLVHELERRLRVNEPVIKFLSVRIDEEQKRLGEQFADGNGPLHQQNCAADNSDPNFQRELLFFDDFGQPCP